MIDQRNSSLIQVRIRIICTLNKVCDAVDANFTFWDEFVVRITLNAVLERSYAVEREECIEKSLADKYIEFKKYNYSWS
uniref:Uncharacterized protein n=1 Tax=Panagrellus redivivus TaxID=6233 RepID=A0A7E4ZVX9_PANRE